MYLCHLLKNKTAIFKLGRFAERIFLFLVSDLKVSTECLQFIIAFLFVCKQISLNFLANVYLLILVTCKLFNNIHKLKCVKQKLGMWCL